MVIDSDSYPYRGMPLTPAVSLELIEAFLERPMPRTEIIRKLTDLHRSGGGSFTSDAHLMAAVKKGLTAGVRKKRLTRPRSGWYAPAGEPDTQDESVVAIAEAPVAAERKFDVVAGSGAGDVYVWFYDVYQQLAEHRGQNHWPCKIGRSEVGAAPRIREQTGYAPEQPRYALLIHTDEPQKLESHLHGFLASRGRQIQNAIGTEWFNTNPEEVLALAVETIWVADVEAQEAA